MTRTQIFLLHGAALALALSGLALWESYGVPIVLTTVFAFC